MNSLVRSYLWVQGLRLAHVCESRSATYAVKRSREVTNRSAVTLEGPNAQTAKSLGAEYPFAGCFRPKLHSVPPFGALLQAAGLRKKVVWIPEVLKLQT